MDEDKIVHLALFKEEEIDQVASAVARLHELHIPDKEITVLSGIPLSEKILGRPMSWSRVATFGLAGALVGFLAALALNIVPIVQYPLTVGGQPMFGIPIVIITVFELSMLGLLISTFLGVFIEMISPSYGPKGYHPKISDGFIGVLVNCPGGADQSLHESLDALGAEMVYHLEDTKLWP